MTKDAHMINREPGEIPVVDRRDINSDRQWFATDGRYMGRTFYKTANGKYVFPTQDVKRDNPIDLDYKKMEIVDISLDSEDIIDIIKDGKYGIVEDQDYKNEFSDVKNTQEFIDTRGLEYVFDFFFYDIFYRINNNRNLEVYKVSPNGKITPGFPDMVAFDSEFRGKKHTWRDVVKSENEKDIFKLTRDYLIDNGEFKDITSEEVFED